MEHRLQPVKTERRRPVQTDRLKPVLQKRRAIAHRYGTNGVLDDRSSLDPFLRTVTFSVDAFATVPSSSKISFDPFVLRSCDTTVAFGFVSNVISSGAAF